MRLNIELFLIVPFFLLYAHHTVWWWVSKQITMWLFAIIWLIFWLRWLGNQSRAHVMSFYKELFNLIIINLMKDIWGVLFALAHMPKTNKHPTQTHDCVEFSSKQPNKLAESMLVPFSNWIIQRNPISHWHLMIWLLYQRNNVIVMCFEMHSTPFRMWFGVNAGTKH